MYIQAWNLCTSRVFASYFSLAIVILDPESRGAVFDLWRISFCMKSEINLTSLNDPSIYIYKTYGKQTPFAPKKIRFPYLFFDPGTPAPKTDGSSSCPILYSKPIPQDRRKAIAIAKPARSQNCTAISFF